MGVMDKFLNYMKLNDEDEYERYCSRKYSSCPYYHSGDEYKTVRKQN